MKNENTPAEGKDSAQIESESALRGAACSASLKCLTCRGSGLLFDECADLACKPVRCPDCKQTGPMDLWGIAPNCADCRWSMPIEGRYDQLRCTNGDSHEAWGDVEATGCCELFLPNDKAQQPHGREKTQPEE